MSAVASVIRSVVRALPKHAAFSTYQLLDLMPNPQELRPSDITSVLSNKCCQFVLCLGRRDGVLWWERR